MKLLLILLIFFPIKSFASNAYYIVPEDSAGLPVIIGTNRMPKNVIYKAPKDDNGKFVTNINDVTILEISSETCIPLINCAEKAKNICVQTDEDGFESQIPNSRVITGPISVSCERARFSADKRTIRLATIQAGKDSAKAKRELFDSKLGQIKEACNGASGLTKLMCEYISRNK